MSHGTIQTFIAPCISNYSFHFLRFIVAFPAADYRNWVQPEYSYYTLIFFGIMLFWWIQTALNFHRTVCASLVATWYFTKEKTIINVI